MKNLAKYLAAIAFLATPFIRASDYQLSSPDGRLNATISENSRVALSIDFAGKPVLESSEIGLLMASGSTLGSDGKIMSATETSVSKEVTQAVQRKQAVLQDTYNAIRLNYENGDAIELRAYDAGVAYRFITAIDGEIKVEEETMTLNFPSGSHSFFPEEESMMSHNERAYPYLDLNDIDESRFCSLPVLIDVPDVARIVFTEADLYNYPAMYLKGGDGYTLSPQFPQFVLKSRPAQNGGDRNVEIIEEAEYIAKSSGTRSFPWRVFSISDNDADFIENELVYLLSRPLELEDTSWIKPGRVAWDWYNANNVYGVDFESGINNDTYKHYIDFASKYGIEYVILDEGWSISTTNLFEPNPDINVPKLVAYGAKRDVEIILWALWKPFDEDTEALFSLYKSWGVIGVKIDFMQRSDQYMVEYYERVARAGAKHEMLVDYHGAFKPAGLRRALPNLISYEGVKGNENNKWSADVTPEHNVTIPFIRMLAGPMDYTPGAMANTNPRSHQINHFRPMGIGTRAHEVAKYTVYESALQMYCDAPSRYLKERETIEFITRIPSVWDETIALAGKVGDYVLVARRSGKTWFIAAMTDENARTLEVDLSFLGKGRWKATVFADGANAKNFAEDYKLTQQKVTAKDTLNIDLAPGGGWSAIIKK